MKFEITKQKLIVVALCALMTLTMVVPSTIPASAQAGAENPGEPQESGDGNQTATEMGNQEPEEEPCNYSGNEYSNTDSEYGDPSPMPSNNTGNETQPSGNTTGENASQPETESAITSVTKFMMETRCSLLKNNDYVSYNVAFPGTPIVITCAQYSNVPKITAAADISSTGFYIRIIDHNGNPVTTNVYVLWIAMYPGQYDDPNTDFMVETRLQQISHNTYVSYNLNFPGTPNVVTCAQVGGVPKIAAPMAHNQDGFTLSLYDHNGNTVTSSTYVMWIAIYPSQYDDPSSDLMIETRCNKQHDFVGMGYNLNFPSTPNVVTCGQSDGSGIARITAPVSHTASGYTLRIIDHDGNYVTTPNSVWTFWIAAYPSQYVTPVDDYELDNSFSQYSTMTVSTTLQSQSRSIYPVNDNDYIRFYAYAGNTYTFYTTGSTDTYGYLYDGLYNQLASNDDGNGYPNFKIQCPILISGYYFLRVKGLSSSTAGPYTLYYSYGNNPPYTPVQPAGPTSGVTGTYYTYSSVSVDPETDNIYYWFDWGDGTNSGWVGPYASGSQASASHSWGSGGSYSVKVKAKDTKNMESGWSSPLTVTIIANSPPTLACTGDSGYTSDGVEPNSNHTGSPFIFMVKYTDANNDAPTIKNVNIDGTNYAMSTSDYIYTDGSKFSYVGAITTTGTHTYYFYFEDGMGGTARLPSSGTWSFTTTNLIPTLAYTGETEYESDGVNPDSADKGSTFTFRIKYTDADNDAPSIRRVNIDGTNYTMSTSDTTYSDGSIFSYSRSISTPGTHNYYFYFTDGYGGTVRLPSSGTLTFITKWYFVQVTDTHIGDSGADGRLNDILNKINSFNKKPEFVIVTGDIVRSNGQSKYQTFLNCMSQLTVPYYCCPGNHDYRSIYWSWSWGGNIDNYMQYVGSRYSTQAQYSFDYANAHIVSLNSAGDKTWDWSGTPTPASNWQPSPPTGDGIYDADMNWFVQDLQNNHNTNTIVFMHHPVINYQYDSWNNTAHWNTGTISQHRVDFKDACSAYNVKCVLDGHTHRHAIYRARDDGINQSGCEQNPVTNYPDTMYVQTWSVVDDTGYRNVSVDGSIVSVSLGGKVTSTATITVDGPAQLSIYDSKGGRVVENPLGGVYNTIYRATYRKERLNQTIGSVYYELDNYTFVISGLKDGNVSMCLETTLKNGTETILRYENISVARDSIHTIKICRDSINRIFNLCDIKGVEIKPISIENIDLLNLD